MELLTLLEAAHSERAQPSHHSVAPQTQTPIYAWEKPSQQAQPRSHGNARSTNHPRARQRTPLRDRPGSTLRMLPNGKLARQRVLLLPNDGGLAHTPVPVIMHDTQSLLEEAARKLELPWAARRFFTPDGIEIASLNQIHPEDVLVVSTGDDFKPRKGPVPRTRSPARTPYQYPAGAVGNNDLRKAASAKSPGRRRGSPGRRMHHVRRCSCRMNDGGAAPDRAVVQASSWQGLCDDAAFQLGLSFGVTRVFTLNGQEVTSIQQVASGMDLVASCGEDFVGRRTGGRSSIKDLEREVMASENRLKSAQQELQHARGASGATPSPQQPSGIPGGRSSQREAFKSAAASLSSARY